MLTVHSAELEGFEDWNLDDDGVDGEEELLDYDDEGGYQDEQVGNWAVCASLIAGAGIAHCGSCYAINTCMQGLNIPCMLYFEVPRCGADSRVPDLLWPKRLVAAICLCTRSRTPAAGRTARAHLHGGMRRGCGKHGCLYIASQMRKQDGACIR